MRVELCKKQAYYYRIVAKQNGKILVTSETYLTKFNAKRAALKMANTNGFPFVDRTTK